jgi:CHAT domain-containing protein
VFELIKIDRHGRNTRRKRLLMFMIGLFISMGLTIVFSHRAIAKIPAIGTIVQVQNSPNSIELGSQLYEAGKFVEAVTVWQQVLTELEAKGDTLDRSRVLSNLSSAYQQLGEWNLAKTAISESLEQLQTYPGEDHLPILAQALNTQGTLYLARSQPDRAFDRFQEATAIYTEIGDETGIIRSTINQVQALQDLGLYRRAVAVLAQLDLVAQPDSLLKTIGLRHWGNVLRSVGNLEQSQFILEQALGIVDRLNISEESLAQESAAIRFALGNSLQAQHNPNAALELYQQALISASPILRIQIQLEQLNLFLETQNSATAIAQIPQIQSELDLLNLSRTAVSARIELARLLGNLETAEWTQKSAKLLATAQEQAQQLGDRRSQSYALGELGELYRKTQQWNEARSLTEQALQIAETVNAPEVAYLWQWQLGKILRETREPESAIAAYTEAVNSLQGLRGDLVAVNPDVQFSFRESVEPVYRELVDLLLRPDSTGEVPPAKLVKARETIESLQVAELENFFQEACVVAKQSVDAIVDNKASPAAIVYPIILDDRVEVILKLPQQPLRHYTTTLPQSQVEATLAQLRENLTKPYTLKEVQSLSLQVYHWLLQPLEPDLTQNQIQTLIFVLDGSLRNLPMAVLYDGKQYLVEKYAIAIAPGLQLIEPQPLDRGKLTALVAGLSESRHGFSPLTFVKTEVEQIQESITSTVILEREFTEPNLETEIDRSAFPIVHLATHGQFSSKAKDTFILAWDQQISVHDFDRLLRNSDTRQGAIDLLVLSACQTAAGDDRAALGLAGIAVRAGARSTLASLWNLDDETSALLMSQFYREIADRTTTKAEALRQTQLTLLHNPRYQHPRYWSPYILVGNWL